MKFLPDRISIAATTPAASATGRWTDQSRTAITIVIPKVITINMNWN
ncbi:MAG: hypothetical protein ACLVJO_04150 [[Clostridium] scindens]